MKGDKIESMTVGQLIHWLAKNAKRDQKVFISRDEEGNGYGTINPESIYVKLGIVIIFPYQERLDLDEIEGGGRCHIKPIIKK